MGRHPARLRSMAPAAAGGAWEDAYTTTLNANSASYRDDCTRQVFYLAATGTASKIRVTFEAASNKVFAVDNASIGLRSGTGPDCTATPTELLFSGVSGFNLGSGQTLVSDELTGTFQNNDEYLISIDNSNVNSNSRFNGTELDVYYIKASDNCALVQNMPAGYTQLAGAVGVLKVEMWVE